MHRYQCRQTPPPPPINHRSLEDHYTSAERPTSLLQSIIDLWKTTTPQQFHGRLMPPPPPSSNRSMQDCYTDYISHIDVCTDTSADRPHPLLQSSRDLWKTITPHKFHIYIAQCTYTYGRLTPPPPPIEHRSLEIHDTK